MTMYNTLQTHAMKAALAKGIRDAVPLGFVEAMDRGTQTLEQNLVQSFINVTENSETLLQASFNNQLRAMSESEDPSISSLASSLLHTLQSKVMPIRIQDKDGKTITPDDGESYLQAAHETLQADLQAYIESLQSQMPVKADAPAPVPQVDAPEAAPAASQTEEVDAETEQEEEK